eukprot:gene22132-biopygen23693
MQAWSGLNWLLNPCRKSEPVQASKVKAAPHTPPRRRLHWEMQWLSITGSPPPHRTTVAFEPNQCSPWGHRTVARAWRGRGAGVARACPVTPGAGARTFAPHARAHLCGGGGGARGGR